MPAQAVIFDTETTGVNDPEPIELAFMALDPASPGQTVETFRFKPTKPIDFGAMATHHILLSDVIECPPSHVASTFLPKSPFLIGHNVDFDWKVMGEPAGRRICTLALSRKAWPDLDSHRLGAVYYAVFGATPLSRARVTRAHGAAADVLMCFELVHHFMSMWNLESFDDLYLKSEEARIPTKWPMGKFYGQPIMAADRGYVKWYRGCTNPPPDEYLLEACRRAGLM